MAKLQSLLVRVSMTSIDHGPLFTLVANLNSELFKSFVLSAVYKICLTYASETMSLELPITIFGFESTTWMPYCAPPLEISAYFKASLVRSKYET